MTRLAALLFALLLFSRPALPLVVFALNYDYISKELCINKDNDNLDCHGKCQLKMELANASGHHQGSQAPKLKLVDAEVLFIEPAPFSSLIFYGTSNGPVMGHYLNLYYFQYGVIRDQPPIIV